MANHKSAKKRILQNEKCRVRNRMISVTMRTYVKKVREAAESGDVAAAQAALPVAIRHLERAAAKGVIHQNRAHRKVGRLVKLVNRAAAQA